MAIRLRRFGSRPVVLAAVGLFVTGSTGLAQSTLAAASSDPLTSGEFAVSARADAWRITVVDPAAPAVPAGQPAVENTPASAQATLDSLGTSAGFASAPYPGDLAASAPGLVNGVGSGSMPPLPDYPFIVASSYPNAPSAEQTNGPYSIRSTSDEDGTRAAAHVAVAYGSPTIGSAQATSSAIRDAAAGMVRAQAGSAILGFSLGPTLTIGEISGHAEIDAEPGKKPVKRSTFSVGSVTIAGVTVGFGNKGIQPGQGTIPGQNLTLLTDQLRQSGIVLTYLPASETDSSVDSAGLAVEVVREFPGRGKVTTTYILGRVRASAQASAVTGGVGTDGSSVLPDTGVPASAAPEVGEASSNAGAPTAPVAPSPVSASLSSSPVDSSSALTGPMPPDPSGAVTPAVQPAAKAQARPGVAGWTTAAANAALWRGSDASGVFLAMIAASLALLVASVLFGGVGVRLLFRSKSPATGGAAAWVLRLPAVVVLGVAVAASLLIQTPAHADDRGNEKPPARAAVVGPTLNMFAWGSGVGGPIMCSLMANSIAGTAAGVKELSAAVSPAVSQFTAQCAANAAEGGKFFGGLNDAVTPAAAINPHLNPLLEAFAQIVEGLGKQFGPSLAPFGPAVVSLGADIRFFKGS